MAIYALLCCFTDEVKYPYAYRIHFVIWSCIRIKDEVSNQYNNFISNVFSPDRSKAVCFILACFSLLLPVHREGFAS